MLITSILTADVYLTFAIFIFTLLASVAISCSFLEKSFQENKQKVEDLNYRYIASIVSVAFSVLMSAFLIFPILPRARINSKGADYSSSRLGYTEQINLNHSDLFAHGGKVMLKIKSLRENPSKDFEILTIISGGLVRARTLSHFDGEQWREPGPPKSPDQNHIGI